MFNSLKTNVIFLVIDILASAANLIFWLLYRYNLGLIFAIVGFVNMFIMLLLVFLGYTPNTKTIKKHYKRKRINN